MSTDRSAARAIRTAECGLAAAHGHKPVGGVGMSFAGLANPAAHARARAWQYMTPRVVSLM